MFRSQSQRLLRTLLPVLAALTLGGATSHAQTVEAPAEEAPARFVAGAESAALRRGFKLAAAADYAARFPVDAPDGTRAENSSSASPWAEPQNPQSQPSSTFTPLTAGQKMRRAGRAAFLSPAPYAFAIFNGALTQWGEDSQPHKTTEDEIADAGSRAARNFTTGATRTIFGSGIYPAIFKQDPRYERSPRKGFGPRTLHALSRVFITRGDNGKHQPNVSRLAGIVTAASLANIWERSTPGHDRIGADATVRRVVRRIGNEAILNVVLREFWPDIMKIFRR